MIWVLDVTESRNPAEANSILDDPKQLLVGVALYPLAGEIGCARVHPLPGWPLCKTIIGMTYPAIQPVVCTSSFNACFGVLRARRNSVQTGAVNEEMLGQIGQARFNRPRLMHYRQVNTHQCDPISTTASTTIVHRI